MQESETKSPSMFDILLRRLTSDLSLKQAPEVIPSGAALMDLESESCWGPSAASWQQIGPWWCVWARSRHSARPQATLRASGHQSTGPGAAPQALLSASPTQRAQRTRVCCRPPSAYPSLIWHRCKRVNTQRAADSLLKSSLWILLHYLH